MITSIESKPIFDINAVVEIVSKSTNNITMVMVMALMEGLKEKLNFPQLAAKHINVQFETELSNTDEKTKMVFNKLHAATSQHIQQFSPPLQTMFMMMGEPTSKLYLNSFVFEGAKQTVETLKLVQPEALEMPEIWQ